MIYIVDDDKDLLDSIQLLMPSNMTVKYFTDPVDALKNITTDIPCIVVSDVMMKGLNGVSFVDIALNILKKSHVVLISANSLEQISTNFGAIPERVKFFRKPLEDDFFKKIEEMNIEYEKEFTSEKKGSNKEEFINVNLTPEKVANGLQRITSLHKEMSDICKMKNLTNQDLEKFKRLHETYNKELVGLDMHYEDKNALILKLNSIYGPTGPVSAPKN